MCMGAEAQHPLHVPNFSIPSTFFRRLHLLVGEPRIASLSVAIQLLKQQTSRKLNKCGEAQFRQRRYYDFNV